MSRKYLGRATNKSKLRNEAKSVAAFRKMIEGMSKEMLEQDGKLKAKEITNQ